MAEKISKKKNISLKVLKDKVGEVGTVSDVRYYLVENLKKEPKTDFVETPDADGEYVYFKILKDLTHGQAVAIQQNFQKVLFFNLPNDWQEVNNPNHVQLVAKEKRKRKVKQREEEDIGVVSEANPLNEPVKKKKRGRPPLKRRLEDLNHFHMEPTKISLESNADGSVKVNKDCYQKLMDSLCTQLDSLFEQNDFLNQKNKEEEEEQGEQVFASTVPAKKEFLFRLALDIQPILQEGIIPKNMSSQPQSQPQPPSQLVQQDKKDNSTGSAISLEDKNERQMEIEEEKINSPKQTKQDHMCLSDEFSYKSEKNNKEELAIENIKNGEKEDFITAKDDQQPSKIEEKISHINNKEELADNTEAQEKIVGREKKEDEPKEDEEEEEHNVDTMKQGKITDHNVFQTKSAPTQNTSTSKGNLKDNDTIPSAIPISTFEENKEFSNSTDGDIPNQKMEDSATNSRSNIEEDDVQSKPKKRGRKPKNPNEKEEKVEKEGIGGVSTRGGVKKTKK